jgi:hypothetical protein
MTFICSAGFSSTHGMVVDPFELQVAEAFVGGTVK